MAKQNSSHAADLSDRRTVRQQQADETVRRIVMAARDVFAEKGFVAASTRDIAGRAGTNQGLITYYFKTKEGLWRAAVDSLFDELGHRLGAHLAAVGQAGQQAAARSAIKEFVRFAAQYPEFFWLLIDEGRLDDERLKWLVKTHLKPQYERIATGLLLDSGLEGALLPHAFYTLAGAASLIFAVAPECKRLTGLNPMTDDAIERHADFVAHMFVTPQFTPASK